MKRIRFDVETVCRALNTRALLGGCVLWVFLGGCVLWAGSGPAPLPRTSDTVPVQVRFQGRAPAPDGKEMFVCGRVGPDNEFWCVDYFLFQQHVSVQ